MAIDQAKLDEFAARFAGDLGAVFHAATVLVGDKLGPYAAMVDSKPVTAAQLAGRIGCDERVEPRAGDQIEDNLNPVGRIFYSASTLICVPASRSQEVGLAIGAQAGEARTRAIVKEAGFTRFRRAAETPFNAVYEARP